MVDLIEGRADMQIKGQKPVPFDPGVALPIPTLSVRRAYGGGFVPRVLPVAGLVLGSGRS